MMQKLPGWMRVVMLATAALNIAGAAVFLPAASALRSMAGLPADTHPFYTTVLCLFILIFGLAYAWAGVTGYTDRLFIAVSAAGKLAFSGTIVWYVVSRVFPASTLLAGVGDLIVGVILLYWFLKAPSAAGGQHSHQTSES